MTPLSAFFVASLAGAMLFFFAGFLSARRRELAVATAGATASASDRGLSPADIDALRTELEQQHRLVGEMQRERSRLVERLERAEQADDWSADSDTAVQLDVLRRRVAEVDEIADENGRLKRTVEQLQKELTTLRSTRTVARPAVPPPAPVRARVGTERGTEFALDRVLAKLVAQRGVEAVVLADDLGLPIAGAGDHTTALAALAGYLDDATRKATEFLPLATIQRICIEDDASRAVTVSPLTVSDSRIVLVALSAGASPSAAVMTKTLEGAARMI